MVLAIPNNSGQSDQCMVTCLQKSHAKLVGDESQAPFSSIFCHRQPTTRRRYLCLYEGRRFLYPFQPERGSLCALQCFLSYLFDLLKSQVPSVEELVAEEQVRKHCKAQRVPCPGWKGYKNIFSSYKVENHLSLVVGDGKFEIKLLQRCCEAFIEYLCRAGTVQNLISNVI